MALGTAVPSSPSKDVYGRDYRVMNENYSPSLRVENYRNIRGAKTHNRGQEKEKRAKERKKAKGAGEVMRHTFRICKNLNLVVTDDVKCVDYERPRSIIIWPATKSNRNLLAFFSGAYNYNIVEV